MKIGVKREIAKGLLSKKGYYILMAILLFMLVFSFLGFFKSMKFNFWQTGLFI
jgi:hypothetical protein